MDILNLPDSVHANIATQLLNKQDPPALLFLEGQYLFRWQENGTWHYKFVSPVAVKTAFNIEPLDSGWLPPGVVRYGSSIHGDWVAQFHAPSVTELKIYTDDGTLKEISVPLPALVFLKVGNNCYVWATDSSAFAPDSTAFHCPLPNIYSGGKICFGRNLISDCATGAVDAAWNLFITSPFNRELCEGKSRSSRSDIREQLFALNGKRKYPLKDLEPISQSGKSISQVVDLIVNASS